MWSALIGAGASLAGGALSAITGKNNADREYERQKEFAQNGIRWKVADAKAAGIHPLYALGAHAASYSPQAVSGSDYGLSQMGQNISRAIEAKQTPAERELADLQRENAKLQNDLLRSQIGRTDAETSKLKSDNLWSELDYVTRQARLSEKAVSTAQTQRQPPMVTTQKNVKDVASVGEAQSGIIPYRYGDTYFDFPPSDVADTMESPSMQAAWRGAVEVSWRTDPTLYQDYVKALIPSHRKMVEDGTHKIIRVPGIGVRVVPWNWTPEKSAFEIIKDLFRGTRNLVAPAYHNGGGGI